MSIISFTLHLTSDGELGSGLGNEVVNDIVARDHLGRPVLRGSHLKGLLRATLEQLGSAREWPPILDELCFGRGGVDHDDGASGLVRLGDAHAQPGAKVRTITRTKLTELGVVHGASLRTTEAVARGAVFTGAATLAPDAPAAVDLATRLALLSLEAVGGGRSRGGGACYVEVDGETRTPGALLRALDAEVAKGLSPVVRVAAGLAAPTRVEPADGAPVFLRLVFRATDPVCCPETPVVGSNVIRTGLGIPASAVQGALIARLAAEDGELATATLTDQRTRAWPLLPAASIDATGEPPMAVRVALSHRMSKLQNQQGGYDFKDAAIEPYDWRQVAAGSPLKGADGVLLRGSDGRVQLWRSGDLARLVTAHAVHHDPTGDGKRNLFTVEALAPVVFVGLMSLPAGAAARLRESLARDPSVAFGKARTVRGSGTLTATEVNLEAMLTGWHETAFVLQSPAAIPDDWDIGASRAEEVLARLVKESGWGELAELAPTQGHVRVVTQAACGVRFGWNRHGLGMGVDTTRRLRASRVFLPGTVFVLRAPPASRAELLVRGLGVGASESGRQQGFGAVLPHPGIASSRLVPRPAHESLKSGQAGKLAFRWFSQTRTNGRGPSPSQISAVAERIDGSGNAALEYLERQRAGRASRIWERWKPVYDDIRNSITKQPEVARRALRTWQDLAIIHRKDEER